MSLNPAFSARPYANHPHADSDYPPFFAHFEHFLSHLAYIADPAMVQLHNLDYASPLAVGFQRLSVMGTEAMVLGTALIA